MVIEEWRSRAACRPGTGADPDQFAPSEITHGGVPRHAAKIAETYCGGCPVVAQCGQFASRTTSIGLFGGASRYTKAGRYVVVDHLNGNASTVSVIAAEPEPEAHNDIVGAGELAEMFGYASRNTMARALNRWGVQPREHVMSSKAITPLYRVGDVVDARKAAA